MITNPFTYTTPGSLAEALTLLDEPDAKLLAGGMSLIPLMKLRLASPESIIDLSRIQGLDTITESNGALTIGAMATHHAVESSPLIRSKCPLLAECASHIGDIQVRNMGTMGGSVAHADPAADYPAALVALEAKIHLTSKTGSRTVEASAFFIDAFTTAIEPGEIIAVVLFAVHDKRKKFFVRGHELLDRVLARGQFFARADTVHVQDPGVSDLLRGVGVILGQALQLALEMGRGLGRQRGVSRPGLRGLVGRGLRLGGCGRRGGGAFSFFFGIVTGILGGLALRQPGGPRPDGRLISVDEPLAHDGKNYSAGKHAAQRAPENSLRAVLRNPAQGDYPEQKAQAAHHEGESPGAEAREHHSARTDGSTFQPVRHAVAQEAGKNRQPPANLGDRLETRRGRGLGGVLK